MSELMLFPCSHGEDDPERAIIPFIVASTAAVSGQRAVVVCTVEAAWIGVPGVAERIESDGLPPLADLLRRLVESGGEVWLCSACTTKRGITGDGLVEGCTIVGAATIVEALAEGKALTLG
ncbi:MAG: DsrE family protein [Nitriliruptoraceae bacterium]